ncbi:RNA-binding La domain-containing protein [Histoplasma capsulatum var. duboisii H88]|uniref:RNA-binding La domain-containing protein n=1 Tax=Ajellomyces capsulatus (strain H88) TaxID=544711 RepID=F0UMM1_AJEC8|nr:RNA-binding La domain-containing protein [Histoplasma capsulatum var. duboisii H88]QSS53510.1 RNA-binding La domain-containing protein [Histoplasma capsulatum var. duboisii H88]
MAEERNQVAIPPEANPNVQAEDDLKQVAELKAQAPMKEEGQPVTQEPSGEKYANPDTNGKLSEGQEGGVADEDMEAKEEARIIAAAAKLGQDAESKSESKSDSKGGELKDTNSDQRQSSRGGRGANRLRVNYRDNIKSDVSTLKETSDPDEIRKQVEFYFSDSNLLTDKFLLSKVGGSENRPVELSLLHSFKRMGRFQPFSAVVDALKDSKTLELTDDDTCVRRKVALPETVKESLDPTVVKVFEDKAMHRSIYAKGFGPEEPSTQFDIEAFFTPYGPTNAIRLRRTAEKIFKGSVFVEFDSEETQKAFLALEPKPKWKGTTELLIKSKKDYCDGKIKDIEAGRLRPNTGRGRGAHRGRGRGASNHHDRRGDDNKKNFRGSRGGRGQRGGRGGRQEAQKDSRGVPVIQVPAVTDNPAAKAGQKRSREDDGDAAAATTANGNGHSSASNGTSAASADVGAPPAKKVDVKES